MSGPKTSAAVLRSESGALLACDFVGAATVTGARTFMPAGH
jgi:hypothetical protein